MDIFRGEGPIEPIASLDERPMLDRSPQRAPQGYCADAALQQAVNVALWLDMPLLLTGEPGTGKTQLAYRVAAEFGLGEPLTFETKSSSVAQDLFYTYDAVRRFALAQVKDLAAADAALDPRRFIRYQALGLAILLANEEAVARRWLPADHDFSGYRPRRSVVLIDEIDKAPRDFPNDLLNEVDRRAFKVPEVGDGTIAAPPARAPIVIITSNSEKQLPDAFLRRCVYHHIVFPKDRLVEIVKRRMPRFAGRDAFLNDAIPFFLRVRDAGLAKKPSTAELINWLDACEGKKVNFARGLKPEFNKLRSVLSTLAKTQEDIALVEKELSAWCGVETTPK